MGRKPKQSTYDWTNEKEEKLIQWWEETEYLYNLQCRDYRDTAKKDRAVESIATKIGTTGEDQYFNMALKKNQNNGLEQCSSTASLWPIHTWIHVCK